MRSVISVMVIVLMAVGVNANGVSDFDELPLSSDSHWSGNYPIDTIGGNYDNNYFQSGSAIFENHSDGDWGIWSGFAYSNETDTTTFGFMNQFSSYAGCAQGGSNFGVGYQDAFLAITPKVVLEEPLQLSGIYVTNTTYAALDMLYGNPGFSKKFGGQTGNDEDWFMLTITGRNAAGESSGSSITFYLADYRFADNSLDYIIDAWTYVDLRSLGVVKTIEFSLSSSDMGGFGMNTPAYFAIDTIIPEPATLGLVALGTLLLRRQCRPNSGE